MEMGCFQPSQHCHHLSQLCSHHGPESSRFRYGAREFWYAFPFPHYNRYDDALGVYAHSSPRPHHQRMPQLGCDDDDGEAGSSDENHCSGSRLPQGASPHINRQGKHLHWSAREHHVHRYQCASPVRNDHHHSGHDSRHDGRLCHPCGDANGQADVDRHWLLRRHASLSICHRCIWS